jgi:trk system potassium uptake protein
MLARLAETPLLVVLLGVTGALALVPALHAAAIDQDELARSFLYAALILLVLTVMLGIATAAYTPRDTARSQLAALVGAYVVLPSAMVLPFSEAVPDTSLVNAWFEMTSSFTTTGATAYPAARLPDTVHLWRAMVGWYGGFIVLLAATAILAPLSLGGSEVASGRVPGRGASGANRLQQSAEPTRRLIRYLVLLLPIYVGLTAALWLGLLIAGDGATSALIHAMSTLSTSGITGQAGLATGGAGILGEALIFLFLIFAMTRRAFPGQRLAARGHPLHRDPELRLAGLLLLTISTILFLRHWFLGGDVGFEDLALSAVQSLWAVIFTAASFLTTTGFVSSHWQTAAQWSGIGTPGLILAGLAIIGGGVATTAGGVKLLRVYALLRHGERELDRIIHPNSISQGGSETRRLVQEGAQVAWVFFILFAISIAVLVAGLSLLGVMFEPAIVLALSALTTTGPLADVAAGAPILYAELSTGVKLLLGAAMIVGRLETLALLVLILPSRRLR